MKRLLHYKHAFWRIWLLHSLVVWSLIVLFDLIPPFYKEHWVWRSTTDAKQEAAGNTPTVNQGENFLFQKKNQGDSLYKENRSENSLFNGNEQGGSLYSGSIQSDSPLYQGSLTDMLWERFYRLNVEQLVWLDILIFIFIAEINYNFFFRKKNTSLFILSTLVCCLFVALHLVIKAGAYKLLRFDLHDALPAFAVITLLMILYAILRDLVYKKINLAEMRSEKSQAELNVLRQQINPHFFFNTLNSLYGTALRESASRTAESIDELAGIMRYTMNEVQKDFTTVSDEIKFLQNFWHLQRLRLPDRDNIEVITEIDYDGTPCVIAPMLLIPFIENAFKYGISMDRKCWIHIFLSVKEKQLHMRVTNKILKESTEGGHGTGIEHTRRRLQLLYPNQHTLTIRRGDTFMVELSISPLA